MTKQTEAALFDISVLADNAKNILHMVENSGEMDELGKGFKSIIYVTLDYLHRIVQLAESAEKEEVLE